MPRVVSWLLLERIISGVLKFLFVFVFFVSMPESIPASAAMLPDKKINDRMDLMAFIILCVQFVVLDFYEEQCQGRGILYS